MASSSNQMQEQADRLMTEGLDMLREARAATPVRDDLVKQAMNTVGRALLIEGSHPDLTKRLSEVSEYAGLMRQFEDDVRSRKQGKLAEKVLFAQLALHSIRANRQTLANLEKQNHPQVSMFKANSYSAEMQLLQDALEWTKLAEQDNRGGNPVIQKLGDECQQVMNQIGGSK